MRVYGAEYIVALAAGAGLAFAGGSQAAGHRQVRCGRGYVRHSIRVPERRHGRIVRRHGRIVYVHVQRCVRVKAKPKPQPTPTPPAATTTALPAAPPLPLPPATATTTPTTPADTPTTTSTTTTTTTTAPPPPPPAYSGACAARVPGASQTVGGSSYALEGMDTFTKDAPLGSFAQSSSGITDGNSLPVVYTGDHGMGWTEYPDEWPSTYTKPPYATLHEGYEPSTVQSVHDGVLDFYLHDDANGYPVGANPSPLPDGSRHQTYGAWSFCERIDPTDSYDLADFHQAPLLWPQNTTDWPSSESDFPEADLNATPSPGGPWWSAYAHYATTDGQDAQDGYAIGSVVANFDPTQWHVYTQTWGPGFRSYYVDGQLVGTSTNQVWPGPERWQLQLEPSMTGGSGAGHVYVKWVWIGTSQ